MKLKQRVGDFRVRELLDRGYLSEKGDHRVYRVTKRKLTSVEAARAIAQEAGVEPNEVHIAGLKDRQGITTQYMSVARGKLVLIDSPDLKVEAIGSARHPLTSEFSQGNAFELTVRALRRDDLGRLRLNLPLMREHGVLDYFDDQRFGNLTHGQGWLFKDLAAGRVEAALKTLLAAPSPRDDERHQRFKQGLERHWGDWRECRDVAGKFGAHHSVFEHLTKNPGDFAGAFDHIASRIKLIHLYAWQSHLWNRAVVAFAREHLSLEETVVLECDEGTLLSHRGALPPALAAKPTFRLPGERLEDVPADELRYTTDALAQEGMTPAEMRIEGVRGFQLKGEERALVLRPAHLRVRPPEFDNLNPGCSLVKVRFELPRGSYATLVVKRLFARSVGEEKADDEERERRPSSWRDPRGYPRDRDRDRDAGRGERQRDQRGGHGRNRRDR